MSLQVALRLAAFFVGAFLHGGLVLDLRRGRAARSSDRTLRAFFAALCLWFTGSFVALALDGALGEGASLARRLANASAFVGLIPVPGLLLQLVLSTVRERRGVGPAATWERFLVAVASLPVLGLPYAVWLVMRTPEVAPLEAIATLVAPWAIWFAAVLLVAAVLAFGAAPPDAESRRFSRRLTAALVVAAAGLVYAYVLGGRARRFGFTVETLVMASSIMPTLIFVYHVVRYRVLEFRLSDRVVRVSAAAAVVGLHLFVVRELLARARVPSAVLGVVLEAAILIVLILIAIPLAARLGAIARRHLAGGDERLRRRATQAAARIARSGSVDDLARALHDGLVGPDGLAGLALLVAADVPTGAPEVRRLADEAPALAAELESTGVSLWRETPAPADVRDELDRLGAHLALPLRSGGRLHGALLVTAHDRGQLGVEELDALGAVAQAGALALEASVLAEEKVTAERKAAQAERMASIGWMVAAVAHEVKNPLSSIKAISQVLLRESGPDHPWREDLEVITREADRLARAVERLLRTERPESGEFQLVGLTALLDRMRLALDPLASAAGVQIDVHLLASGSRIWGRGDALWEVLYNLATNAIEAMSDGGTLLVEELEPRRRGTVRLRVSDDGPGISPAARGRIFEPFFSTRAAGHGLGLAIVRRRLSELGGDIRLVESERGAMFELTLPAVEAETD